MLVFSRKRGEKVILGNRIEVEVVDTKTGSCKLSIKAPRNIPVHRGEIQEKISSELGVPAMYEEWFAVKDRLPDDDVVVLAHSPDWTGDPVWPAVFEGESGSWRTTEGSFIFAPITHWMHFPPAPHQ